MAMSNRSNLKCRKWTLICLIITSGVAHILLMIISIDIVGDHWKDMKQPEDQTEIEWEESKRNSIYAVKVAVIVGGVLSVLIELVGLIAAYKEYYGLTVVFSILMAFASVASLFSALKSSWYFIGFAFNWVIFVLAFVLSYDIRKAQALTALQMSASSTVYPLGPNQYK